MSRVNGLVVFVIASVGRLEDEETKLWHLSAHALYEMYQEEVTTGKITYPEEA